jgi:hypothetical protein
LINEETIAYCEYNNNSYRIYFNLSNIHNFNENDLQLTMFHEITHCELGMDHSPDENNYMYAYYNEQTLEEARVQFVNNIESFCSSKE